MPEEWQPYKNGYERLTIDRVEAFMRTAALPQGFLWQCAKRYGFQDTLEKAKAMAEGHALNFSLPPARRWLSL